MTKTTPDKETLVEAGLLLLTDSLGGLYLGYMIELNDNYIVFADGETGRRHWISTEHIVAIREITLKNRTEESK